MLSPALRIELRRGIGRWVGVLVAAAAVGATVALMTGGIVLWRDVSEGLQYSVILGGPAAAAGAAWSAGRERRKGTTEVLASCGRPTWDRRWPSLLAIVLWVGTGFVVGSTTVLVWAATAARWGVPDMQLIASGLMAALACAAVGFLVGHVMPYVLTAAAVALAVYVMLALPAYADTSVRLLTPINFGPTAPFFNVPILVAALQVVFFAAVALIAGSGVWLMSTRYHVRPAAVLVAAAALAALTCIGLLRLELPVGATIARFTPTCTDEAVQVCVHPAYASLLPRVANVAQEVLQPLIAAGITLPSVQQDEQYRSMALADGEIRFVIAFSNNEYGDERTALSIATAAVTGYCPSVVRGDHRRRTRFTQSAVAGWLVEEAGHPEWEVMPRGAERATRPLARATSSQQQQWLRRNLSEVRACEASRSALRRME